MTVTVNDLLDALIAYRPNQPGPEWSTVQELVDGATKKGQKIGKHSMQVRLTAMLKEGKVEQIKGPRRGIGCGWQFYYKFKNGKGTT